MSLIILVILIVGFTILALRNWKKTIGAGPTILIVGAIVVSVFGAVKWADYQQQIRQYDVCVARVERSEEIYSFNNTLVTVIEEEVIERPDIGQRLRKAVIVPLTMDSCPTDPTFLNSFSQ